MKKSIISLFIALAMMCAFTMPIYASDSTDEIDDYSFSENIQCLIDEPDVLSNEQETEILARLQNVSLDYITNVCAAIVSSLGEASAESAAKRICEEKGFGGDNDSISSTLLLISVEDRAWCIYTNKHQDSLNSNERGYIYDSIEQYIETEDYSNAILKYADAVDYLYTLRADGTPYGVKSKEKKKTSGFVRLLISLGIGLVAAFIGTSSMKGELKSVHAKSEASQYVRKNSLKLTKSSDDYVRKELKKTKKQTETNQSTSGKY